MAGVIIKNLFKKYGDTTTVRDISLEIKDKEFVVLVGPSGCGKSTTLRMIAGLEEISSGELYIDDKLVNHIPPKDRDIAMVFQNYALYPHMTVFQNMAFGLKLKKVAKTEIEKRVLHAANTVGLTDFVKRKPGTLSGGQRQRVALGRAIVRNPKVFLFDEPLSNLDAKLRVQMRMEISSLQKRLGITTIYVTHDQTEAMTMADRIAVLKDGVLQQYDTPMQMYHFPANIFVAGFIGSPSMNLVLGRIDQESLFRDTDGALSMDLKGYMPAAALGREVLIGIRPEDIQGDNELQKTSYLPIKIVADTIEPLGSDSFLYFRIGQNNFTARIRPESAMTEGEKSTVFIDRQKLHFFDPASGLRIS